MKNHLVCPKCDGRKLWKIDRFRTDGNMPRDHSVPIAFYSAVMGIGSFDIYVCAGCGYTEFWADGMERLKVNPDRGVHFIDNSLKQGVYR